MDGPNEIKFWHYVVIIEDLICAKASFEWEPKLDEGRMRRSFVACAVKIALIQTQNWSPHASL